MTNTNDCSQRPREQHGTINNDGALGSAEEGKKAEHGKPDEDLCCDAAGSLAKVLHGCGTGHCTGGNLGEEEERGCNHRDNRFDAHQHDNCSQEDEEDDKHQEDVRENMGQAVCCQNS